MVNTQELKNYLKMKDLHKGQSVLFLDAGAIKEVEFEDKKTKEMVKNNILQFSVQVDGGKVKQLTLNKISINNLEQSLGPDTEKWKDQVCLVEIVNTLNFGEMVKTPVLVLTEWDKEHG